MREGLADRACCSESILRGADLFGEVANVRSDDCTVYVTPTVITEKE